MAAALADSGPAPAVHLAHAQSSGRGRHGRTWESPPGNLYATIRWPEGEGFFPPGLLAAVQLAWARAVRDAGGPEVRCKWPNDGMLGDAKWAGLIAVRPAERTGELHLGLGANLAVAPAVEGAATACLADAWPEWPGEEAVAAILVSAALEILREGPPSVPARLADWPPFDALSPGDRLIIEGPGGPHEGVYGGIDEQGRLRLVSTSGEVRLTSGGAHRVRPA